MPRHASKKEKKPASLQQLLDEAEARVASDFVKRVAKANKRELPIWEQDPSKWGFQPSKAPRMVYSSMGGKVEWKQLSPAGRVLHSSDAPQVPAGPPVKLSDGRVCRATPWLGKKTTATKGKQ